MPAGEMTAQAARRLTQQISDPRFVVLFDHGNPRLDGVNRVGQIASWFGNHYDSNSRLALLDIAVIDRRLNTVLALVEIEETSVNPKTIIGDAFGFLFGDHLTFQGEQDLVVGDFTSFLILVKGAGAEKRLRCSYLQKQISAAIKQISSQNATIGDLSIDIFEDEARLYEILDQFIKRSIAAYLKPI